MALPSYTDDSLAGLTARLDAMRTQQQSVVPPAPAPAPVIESERLGATRAVEDQYRTDLGDKLRNQADEVSKQQGLSDRQRASAVTALAGQAGAAGIDLTPGDYIKKTGLSSRQVLGINQAAFANTLGVDRFNKDRSIEDTNAMYKRPREPVLSYQNGGKPETAEQLLARISGSYGVGNKSTPAPAPAASPAPAPVAAKPAGSLIQDAANVMSNRTKQIDKAAGYARGGKPCNYAQGGKPDGFKVTGPGTATSDEIPATTGTGENIRIANGERVVSVAQDAALEKIAKMLGYESVDAMFEALTGKPVGPTVKGGKLAAANGYKDENGVYHPASVLNRTQAALPANVNQAALLAPSAAELQAKSDQGQLIKGAKSAGSAALDIVTLPGRAISDVIGAGANVGARIINAAAGKPVIEGRYESGLEKYGMTPFYDAAVRGDEAPAQAPLPAASPTPAPAQAPTPTQSPAQAPGSAIQSAATGPIDNMIAPDLTTKDILPGGYIDRGAGIVAQRGKAGQLNVTNVGTQNLTDPNKQVVDGSAGALIDQKNSTYNPKQQLANLQRLRQESDAVDPTITDPNVRASAVQGVNILNAARQGRLQEDAVNAQLSGAKQTQTQQAMLADLQAKFLASTDPQEQAALAAKIHGFSGKGKDEEFKIATVRRPDPNNPMGYLEEAYVVGAGGKSERKVGQPAAGGRRVPTEAEITATAKLYNLTNDQVKQRLGLN